jgi:hypothetical protein
MQVNDIAILTINFPRLCLKIGDEVHIDRVVGNGMFEVSSIKGERNCVIVFDKWLRPKRRKKCSRK